MNYERVYNSIIDKRRQTPAINHYFERHHIIPKCIGGTDCQSNIIQLTAREHFVCHLLLYKMYQNTEFESKLLRACIMMNAKSDNQDRSTITSRVYQKLKEKFAQQQSINQRGKSNSQYGSRWVSNPYTEESIKISKQETLPKGFYEGRGIIFVECEICGNQFLRKKSSYITTCSETCKLERKEQAKRIPLCEAKCRVSQYHELFAQYLCSNYRSINEFVKHTQFWSKTPQALIRNFSMYVSEYRRLATPKKQFPKNLVVTERLRVSSATRVKL